MGCCGGSRAGKTRRPPNRQKSYDVMGGYKYLQAHQIRARLEVYKRIHCKQCERRYECDYEVYKECQKYRIDK